MKNKIIYMTFVILLYSSVVSLPKWNIEVVDNTECVGDYSSIELDSNDHPHISYSEYGRNNDHLRYAYFDGSKWNIYVVDSYSGSSSISLDSNNLPHVSYLCYSESEMGLKYAYFDGTKWNIEIVDNSIRSNQFGISIALDSKERPHISYCDAQFGDL
ncbi:MAG: hypothetical protein ACUVWP_06255 [bacterium]